MSFWLTPITTYTVRNILQRKRLSDECCYFAKWQASSMLVTEAQLNSEKLHHHGKRVTRCSYVLEGISIYAHRSQLNHFYWSSQHNIPNHESTKCVKMENIPWRFPPQTWCTLRSRITFSPIISRGWATQTIYHHLTPDHLHDQQPPEYHRSHHLILNLTKRNWICSHSTNPTRNQPHVTFLPQGLKGVEKWHLPT